MSDTRDPARDQRLPTMTTEPYVQDQVIGDLTERKEHGIRKYGTALQPGNGRDHLQDAYEEGMDLVVYLRAEIEFRRNLQPLLDAARTFSRAEVAGSSAETFDAACNLQEKARALFPFKVDEEEGSPVSS